MTEYETLLAGIARHLPGWTVQDNGEEAFAWRYTLVNGNGPRISINTSRYTKGMLHVSGFWPQGRNRWTSPSDVREEAPEINVSSKKTHEQIAKDITRRFLPEYLRIYTKLEEHLIAGQNYSTLRLQNFTKLTEAGLVPAYRMEPENPHGEVRLKGATGETNYDLGYGTVHMDSATSVRMDLRSLPVETAVRVLKALQGVA